MYKEYINSKVVVIVSSKAETLWEYTGVLCDLDENSIKLRDVQINQVMLNFQKNMFGSGMSAYNQEIEEVILNKNYVISCYKK